MTTEILSAIHDSKEGILENTKPVELYNLVSDKAKATD